MHASFAALRTLVLAATALLCTRMRQASRRQANAGAMAQPRLPGFCELNSRPVVSAPQFMKDMDKKDDNTRQRRHRPSSGTDLGLSQVSVRYKCTMKAAWLSLIPCRNIQ